MKTCTALYKSGSMPTDPAVYIQHCLRFDIWEDSPAWTTTPILFADFFAKVEQLDNQKTKVRWYCCIIVNLRALDYPDDIHRVGVFAGAIFVSHERFKIARRVREALIKACAIMGPAQTGSAILTLGRCTPVELNDLEARRAKEDQRQASVRGYDLPRRVCSENACFDMSATPTASPDYAFTNSRALRRLAADHAALHNHPLPPNYLFPPASSSSDDLTSLDILLAGPTHTPFSSGIWKLHLTIPPTYPQQPPTAHFRTPIFHPNVEPTTGAVCVETLKRDWDAKLTLRDVLVTISCLLIQPNPDSALNAEAGALIQEDFEAFAGRAELMTGIHAGVAKEMREMVREAQCGGQEEMVEKEDERRSGEVGSVLDAPLRRRRATARQRGTVASRRSDGSPSGAGLGRSKAQAGPSRAPAPPAPFVVQTSHDDVFGGLLPSHENLCTPLAEDDSRMLDVNQENDESKSPTKAKAPVIALTPKRPQGVAVPLGELNMGDISDDSIEMEAEYPPSPRKSPAKGPSKQRQQPSTKPTYNTSQAESSHAPVLQSEPTITPPNNPSLKPLAEDSPFVSMSPSPRKNDNSNLFRPATPGSMPARLGALLKATPGKQSSGADAGIFKTRSPSSSEKKRRNEELDGKLWELCGRDVQRWNRGDFGEGAFEMKAKRW